MLDGPTDTPRQILNAESSDALRDAGYLSRSTCPGDMNGSIAEFSASVVRMTAGQRATGVTAYAVRMTDLPENSSTSDEGNLDPTDADQSTDQSTDSSTETLGGTSPGQGNLEKDPSEWVSGGDPMTEAQRSYLDTLASQAGEELPADLNKAQASEHIERLKPSS